MYNINFLPNWYKKKKLNSLKRIIIAISICIFLLDIILSLFTFQKINSLNNKNKRVEEIKKINAAQISNTNRLKSKRMDILISFREFLKYLQKDITINILDLTDTEIILEATAKSKDDYFKLIEDIEKDKRFSLLNISVIGHKEDNIIFRIIIDRSYKTQ